MVHSFYERISHMKTVYYTVDNKDGCLLNRITYKTTVYRNILYFLASKETIENKDSVIKKKVYYINKRFVFSHFKSLFEQLI